MRGKGGKIGEGGMRKRKKELMDRERWDLKVFGPGLCFWLL